MQFKVGGKVEWWDSEFQEKVNSDVLIVMEDRVLVTYKRGVVTDLEPTTKASWIWFDDTQIKLTRRKGRKSKPGAKKVRTCARALRAVAEALSV